MFSFQDGIAEQFDENCIDITVSQGKTQLQQIELTCRWSDLSINRPVPTLECQWYNKQKDSLELIPKVTGTFYQPCLADLNSNLYVQIVPSCPPLEYIGMPITKELEPLSLNKETQLEAQQLLETGKATFVIQVVQLALQQDEHLSSQDKDYLLQYHQGKLLILEKDSFTTMFTTLIESAVNEQYPQLIFNRSEPTELNIIFNAFNDYAVIRLPDHKIRDVFYLLGQLAKHHFCPVVKESTETERKNFETIATMNTLEDLGDNQEKEEKKIQNVTDLLIVAELKQKNAWLTEENCRHLKTNEKLRFELVKATEELATKKQSLGAALSEIDALKDQIRKCLKQIKELSESVSYFKSQQRLLSESVLDLKQKLKSLREEYEQLLQWKQIFIPQNKNKTYHELQKEFDKQIALITSLQTKTLFAIEEKEKADQQLRLQKMECEKYETLLKSQDKKLQSVLCELSRLNTSLPEASVNAQVDELKKSNQTLQVQLQQMCRKRDYQNKQIQELITENTYLRSKEKSSRKQQLKIEVTELKKLVNRLSEALTEKEFQLNNLKLVNKQISCLIVSSEK